MRSNVCVQSHLKYKPAGSRDLFVSVFDNGQKVCFSKFRNPGCETCDKELELSCTIDNYEAIKATALISSTWSSNRLIQAVCRLIMPIRLDRETITSMNRARVMDRWLIRL